MPSNLSAGGVSSVGRRRAIFRLSDGKSLVIIRENYTDVIDFLSMLCLHSIEGLFYLINLLLFFSSFVYQARKLRQRISSPRSFRLIQDFILQKSEQVKALERSLHEQRLTTLSTLHKQSLANAASAAASQAPERSASTHNHQQSSPTHGSDTLFKRLQYKVHNHHRSHSVAPSKAQAVNINSSSPRAELNEPATSIPSSAIEMPSSSSRKEEEHLGQGLPLLTFTYPKKETSAEQDHILSQVYKLLIHSN